MKWLLRGHCAALLLISAAMVGCNDDGGEVVESSAVPTSLISAEIDVTYDGSNSVNIDVTLREGPVNSDTYVDLLSGDTLKVSTLDSSQLNYSDNLFDNLLEISNQVKTLERGTRRTLDGNTTGIWYYTTTDAKYRTQPFTVSFVRAQQTDAPNSVVYLPPDFRLDVAERSGGSTVSRSGPINVTWSPANTGYTQQISAIVSCSDGTIDERPAVSIANNDSSNPVTSYEFTANTFAFTGNCLITFEVDHSESGSADPALHPTSIIRAHQRQTITIATVE